MDWQNFGALFFNLFSQLSTILLDCLGYSVIFIHNKNVRVDQSISLREIVGPEKKS